MATVAITSNEVVCTTPYLKRKLVGTGGATGLAYTHGEDREPDEMTSAIVVATPTVTTIAVVRTSATQVTIDCLGDSADAIEVYLTWFDQASGGIS